MKIMIFHASAGHGHLKVAEVARRALLKRGLTPAQCTLEDSLESTPRYFRNGYKGIYFYAVKNIPYLWGWSYEILDHPAVYRSLRWLRSLHNRFYGRALLKRVIRESPDVILCTHFFTAELFATAKKRNELRALLITVITDFLPHTFWVNEGTDYYWVMGEDGARNLRDRGVPEGKIIAGGIPVAEAFKPSGRKDEIRMRWGFSRNRLTLLFTSGSFGLGPHEAILNELREFGDKIQCFVVCGNNATLKSSLEKNTYEFPVRVFGFVDFMPDLMEASDLMVAKTGGATTSESLAKGLPMVVLEPIPGQETRNAEVLKAHNASFFMIKPEQIKPIVNTLLKTPSLLENKRSIIRRLAKPDAAEELATFVLNSGKMTAGCSPS